MLKFNELRIASDNKCLIIDVLVEELDYFKNVTIEEIRLDTSTTWSNIGPSEKSILLYNKDIKEFNTIDSEQRVRLEVKDIPNVLDLTSNNMYFVYVKADTSNAPEASTAPCSCNKELILGTVVNEQLLYRTLMNTIPDLNLVCELPMNFINAFLKLLAVDASIRTGNYSYAIEYWKKFFMRNINTGFIKNCGCNG